MLDDSLARDEIKSNISALESIIDDMRVTYNEKIKICVDNFKFFLLAYNFNFEFYFDF